MNHTERCLEVIRWARSDAGYAKQAGAELDTLAYDHARGAARAARVLALISLRPPSLFAKAIRWAEEL